MPIRLHFLLPIALLLQFAVPGAFAQTPFWETNIAPYGGNVGIYPTDDSILYAFHGENRYFRSMDYGVNWSPRAITEAEPGAYSEILEIGRSGIFYKVVLVQSGANWIRRLYRSLDEGATWELRKDNFELIEVWETPAAALLGYGADKSLYRSTDGGLNWQWVANFGISFSQFSTSILYGDNGKILISPATGPLIYSLNDGQTWAEGGDFGLPIGWLSATLALTPDGTLFSLFGIPFGSDTLVMRSTDWGLHWQGAQIDLAPGEYPSSLIQLPSGRLLLATDAKLYFSDDGLNWAVYASGNETADYLYFNTPLPNGDLLGYYKNAMYRSADAGLNWFPSSVGLQMAETKQLILLTDSLQIASSHNGLWRSTDAGDTWTRLLADTSSQFVYANHPIACYSPDSLAVAMGAEIWRTINGGQNFTKITPPGGVPRGDVFAGRGGRLWTTDTLGVLQSNDFGSSWQPMLAGKSLWEILELPGDILIALVSDIQNTNQLSLNRSFDGGANWETLNLPFQVATFDSDLDLGADGVLRTIGWTGHYLAVASTADAGDSWTLAGIPDIYAISDLATNALGHIFVRGEEDILTSVDDGLSWYALPRYEESPPLLFGLEVSPGGLLYVLSSGGPVYRTAGSTVNGGYVRGAIRRDADADCSTPDAQEPLKNWTLEMSGPQGYTLSTSATGQYAAFVHPGVYALRPRVPQNLWWSVCDSLLQVQVDSAETVDSVDFVGVALSECPLLTVDVAIPRLRRCFDNPVYVHYCNSGSEVADSARVDLELDPFLSIVSAELPFTALGGNFFRFQLGQVAPGDCGQFSLTVSVDCDSTVLGQTHCITGYAFPDTLCNPVPGWSGATIEAGAECQDSLVRLRLRNTGTNTSNTLHYIIIEDDVVLFQGKNQYDVNEELVMDYAPNGSTWRIESQQEPQHPFSNLALAFLEGCGGYQSLGFVNHFSTNDWAPSINRVCVENIGSYDPNDKQGFPLGYGDAGRIRPGQELEYLIRFQNTGTDTAFTVVIRDTLSAWLDAASVRPGASSHAYTWSLGGPGVLTFRFDNILLPDSNVNLAASQGFVSFTVQQQADVPLETQIFNAAAIYFDFNPPIITNTTRHTVGIDYITGTDTPVQSEGQALILAQPNPAEQETRLQLPVGTARVILFDSRGRVLRSQDARAQTLRMPREGLPAGLYFLRAEDRQGRVLGRGKVIWR
jgi:uncharacterized repeat protein (TIGR01451 family)